MKYKNEIIFVSIILIVLALLFLPNLVFSSNTIFEKQEGIIIINENFANYEESSAVISLDRKGYNLEKWKNEGVITAWTNIEDYTKIERIDLILRDINGNESRLNGVENINLPRELNKIKSNDEFSDYNFKLCDNQSLRTWEDFMLINGKNFLFWEWEGPLDIDMENIESVTAVDHDKNIEIFDVVVHSGLCQDKNSLGGNWYSPNGLPQYGVWWTEDSKLRMVNVEQEQYPSNGDHVRILSIQDTPENFAMRVRFEVIDIAPNYKTIPILKYFKENERDNTFLRIAWDFDDVYDPGHDQTLLYISGEYSYFGLQRVFPIERYFKQGQEPANTEAKEKFNLKEGKTYEVNIIVKGQNTKAVIYEVKTFYLREKAKVEYTFDMPRPETKYPFSIESTGNIEVALDLIEVKEFI